MNNHSATQEREWLTVELFNPSWQVNKLKRCNYLLLFYVQTGTVNLYLNDCAFSLAAGSMVWLHPQTNYHFNRSALFMGYCLTLYKSVQEAVAYAPDLIYHSKFSAFLSAGQYVSVVPEDVGTVFKSLHEEMLNNRPYKQELLQGYFKILLLSVMNGLNNRETSHEEPETRLVQAFTRLLETNFRRQKFVNDYASELLVTPGYLNAVIKKVTGYAVSYHIRQRIVLEAKRQVAYSGRCMKEIACDLGFGDLPHFSRYFKTTTGINFSTFVQKTFLS